MTDEKLNNLGHRARNGDTGARWEVKAYFQRFIHQLSEANRNRVRNQADFEEECYKIIDATIDRFDKELGNLRQLVVNFLKRRLGRTTRRHEERLKKYGVSLITMQYTEPDDDTPLEYEVPDDLAIIDRDLELKEKIAFLAEGDPRKMAILNAWTYKQFSDSSTAVLLAQSYGGKAESHRKYVSRFKSQCQKALAYAV